MPKVLATLGLLLDISGAWLLAWDLLRARAFLSRHTALERLREWNTERREVAQQADDVRREGFSGPSFDPSFDMRFTSRLKDLDWKIEDLEEKLSTGERHYRLTISRLAWIGAGCLTAGFLLQLAAQWLPAR